LSVESNADDIVIACGSGVAVLLLLGLAKRLVPGS
jgi:hypothetical protein